MSVTIRVSAIALSISLGLAAGIFGACASSPKNIANQAGNSQKTVLTQQEAQIRAKQLHNVNYTLWLGLDQAENLEYEDFPGRVVARFDLKEGAANHSGKVFMEFTGGKIQSLKINGDRVPDDEIAERFDGRRIHFKTRELSTGTNRVEIAFSQTFSQSGEGLHRFKDPVDGHVYLYTQFEPYDAHRLFPCFDQPDLKASYELTVETPAAWSVIANTLERDTSTVDGRLSWAFPPSPIFSTYIFALHAGPFSKWEADAHGIPMRLFARKSLAQYVDAPNWFEVTGAGLDFFNVEFGYPYPYAKYDQVIVPEFNAGAMENVAAVTFSERTVHRSKVTDAMYRGRANTILHEMAHMWFGNLVTMKWWNDLWLNESFATFMATRALDQISREQVDSDSARDVSTRFKPLKHAWAKSAWQDFFGAKQWGYWEDQLVTTHPIEVPTPDTVHASSQFDGITYAKGAATLKQLFHFVGEEDFREGLQRYFQRFARKNATASQFFAAIQQSSATPLKDWQRLWVQTPGVNTLEATFECGADSKISSLTLKQGNAEGSAVLRPHRTRIALYGPDLKLQEVIEAPYSAAETQIAEAVGKRCPRMVFPNHEDLDYVRVTLDALSLESARSALSKIESPLARQMLWHTLWEMVVDSRLAASDFIEIFLKHAARERDPQLLGQIVGAISHPGVTRSSAYKFLSPEARLPYRMKLERFAQSQMEASPGGSDLQLLWFHTFLGTAHAPDSAEFLQKLLDGKIRVSGLTIDQERRWELVQTLSRLGSPSVEVAAKRIDDELKRDATDMGVNSSISAEAAIPDAAVKTRWWERMTQPSLASQQGFTHSKLKQAMRSFFLMGQETLTQPFQARYFEALGKITTAESFEFSGNFARYLFPAACTVESAELALKTLTQIKDAPAAITKALRVQNQEELRCVKARALMQGASAELSAGSIAPVKP